MAAIQACLDDSRPLRSGRSWRKIRFFRNIGGSSKILPEQAGQAARLTVLAPKPPAILRTLALMRSAESHATSPPARPVVVRGYEPLDRAALRHIACDTADRGGSIERTFPDRELIADLLTRYYTDYDSTAVWVAEHEGRVIGYLTGCLDSRRYWRTMRWRIVPQAIVRAMGRGILWSGQVWRFLLRGMLSWSRTICRGRIPLRDYPAHVHVNLLSGFRGQHVGQRLLERFCEQARATHISGIHVVVRRDNAGARRLFEKAGFMPFTGLDLAHPAEPDGPSTMIYAKRL